MNKMNKKGFTLIEMLVVIAIIAVLVSIVIPVVGDSTESARQAADAANIRAAIATVSTQALSGETVVPVTVDMTHTQEWNDDITNIGGYAMDNFGTEDVEIGWNATNNVITVDGTDADLADSE